MTLQHAARIGEAAAKLTTVAEEDLPMVVEFLDHLKARQTSATVRPTVIQIRELAKGRARLMQNVPRKVLMARFLELGEEIRQKAIVKGRAIDGEWTSD